MEVKKSDNELSNLNVLINKLISEIKYGNVVLTIQDGKVIQVDRTEKIRL